MSQNSQQQEVWLRLLIGNLKVYFSTCTLFAAMITNVGDTIIKLLIEAIAYIYFEIIFLLIDLYFKPFPIQDCEQYCTCKLCMFWQVIFLKGTHLYSSKKLRFYHETQVSYIYSAGLCKYFII